MNIAPIKHTYTLMHKYNSYKKQPQFKGEIFPSGYYEDSEIETAKKYISQDNWMEKYREQRLNEEMQDFNDKFEECIDVDGEHWVKARLYVLFWPVTLPVALVNEHIKENKANEKIDKEIERISNLMVDINNKKLTEIKKNQAEIKKKQMEEKRKSEIHNLINRKFLKSLKDSNDDINANVSTAVMFYGGTKNERNETIDWVKNQITTLIRTFSFNDNEDDNLYRIQTEINYAQDYFDANKKRTVLFVENFDSILNENLTSNQTIGEMKELMSDINRTKAPVTIIFQSDDIEKISKAFISNKTRIPVMIDLNNSNTVL